MLPSDIRSLTEAYKSIYAPKEETVEITEELLDEAFDELVDEFIEEGYEEEEALSILEEATDAYLEEAKVTFGSDTTPMRASGARVGARRRYGRRKAGEALKAAGEKAKSAADTVKKKAAGAVASAQIAGSIAKDEARRAGRAAQHSVTKAVDAAKRAPGEAKKKAKSGIKGFIKRQAEKVVKRMSEETIQEADSIAAMRERAAKRRKQRYGASDTSRGGRDDFRPYTKADYERGEANDPRKKQQKEEFELDEAITSEKGKAKAAEMIAKRSTPSGRAKSGQGASVAAIKHISRANVDNLGGTPPNPKIAKNPVKSRSYGGTGNAAARRAAALKKEEFELWVNALVEEGYDLSDYTWDEMYEFYLDEDSRRMSNKQKTASVRQNIKAFGSNFTPPNNYDPDANRGKGEVLTRKQIEKKRRKALRQEDVEFVDEARAMGSARSGDQNPKGSQVRVSSGRGMTMTPARGLGASKPKGDDVKRKAKYDAQAKADRRAAARDRAAEGEDRVGRLIRKVQREELEATGLFSKKELDGMFEQMTTQTQIPPVGDSLKPGNPNAAPKPVKLPPPTAKKKPEPKLGAGTPGFGYGVGTGP